MDALQHKINSFLVTFKFHNEKSEFEEEDENL